MRAKRLEEVRQLLETSQFRAWWSALQTARASLVALERRVDEFEAAALAARARAELAQNRTSDAFYGVGAHEERAGQFHAQAEALENRGFPVVAQFEEQRFHVSEIWYRLGAAEHGVEQAKAKAGDVAQAERRRAELEAEYKLEDARKNALWDEVESLWAESCEVALRASEEKLRARKVRREAELALTHAEQSRQAATSAEAELSNARAVLKQTRDHFDARLRSAAELFGCAVGQDFLFFRHPGDSRYAWAIALADDRDTYNLEVRCLAVYLVEKSRGVGFLEPARVPTFDAEGDKRFEDYFLKGRRGQPRAVTH